MSSVSQAGAMVAYGVGKIQRTPEDASRTPSRDKSRRDLHIIFTSSFPGKPVLTVKYLFLRVPYPVQLPIPYRHSPFFPMEIQFP